MGNTATNPYPPDGDDNGASPNVVLRWDAGDNAAPSNSHDLYFGTDRNAVLSGDTASHVGTLSATRWAPPALVEGATYYWRVDEINLIILSSRWVGAVWSFRVFSSSEQLAGYENGYATWCSGAMTLVNLADGLPAGASSPPSAQLSLAQCESTSFQVAIQPSTGRRLDRVRLLLGDLTGAVGTLSAANISWQLVGLVLYHQR